MCSIHLFVLGMLVSSCRDSPLDCILRKRADKCPLIPSPFRLITPSLSLQSRVSQLRQHSGKTSSVNTRSIPTLKAHTLPSAVSKRSASLVTDASIFCLPQFEADLPSKVFNVIRPTSPHRRVRILEHCASETAARKDKSVKSIFSLSKRLRRMVDE